MDNLAPLPPKSIIKCRSRTHRLDFSGALRSTLEPLSVGLVFGVAWMAVLIFCASLNAAARQEGPAQPKGPEGSFRGEIETPGGAVVFGVNLRWHDGLATTSIRCGGETWQIAETSWDGNTLTLDMPEFDAKIEARRENSTRYVGTYQRVRSATSTASLPFRMIPPLPDLPGGPVAPFKGRWKLRFADSDSDSVAIFDGKENGAVSGTIMTTTGDYRFLGGRVDATTQKLHLSAFDGGHVFYITASLANQGKLIGDFWSGDSNLFNNLRSIC